MAIYKTAAWVGVVASIGLMFKSLLAGVMFFFICFLILIFEEDDGC